MALDHALEAARRARHAFAVGDARDAAWLALYATELDPGSGLGLAVAARILHGVSGDPLATLGTRRALSLPIPEPDRTQVARFHRIDLWSRGLLAHVSGQALLPASAFDDPTAFQPTEAHDGWLRERIEGWGSEEAASRALRRLLAALSDAWEVPTDASDPLRSPEPWLEMPAYAEWKADDPLAEKSGSSAFPWAQPLEGISSSDGADDEDDHEQWGEDDDEPELDGGLEPPSGYTVVSDYWTAHAVERLEDQGRLAEAAELAGHWARLRPGRIPPKIAQLRIAQATGQDVEAARLEREVLAIETDDLNELEEARVGLGLLRRYPAQLELLDRMLELAPGHAVLLAHRGAVALELGSLEAAERDLRLALELEPESGPALTNLALLRMRESDYVAARALLEEAKALFPEEPMVRCYLAACLQNQAHPEAALEEARRAVELDPTLASAHALLATLEGGTFET